MGITGAPGAGKSTLTDRLVSAWRRQEWASDGRRPGGGAGRRPLVAPSPAGPSWVTGCACRATPSTTGCSSGRWPPAAIWAAWRWRCPTPSGCSRRWGCRWCWSRRWASASRRWRWPRPPTPPSWWSTPGGATPSRPTRPGLLEIADLFVINKADRPGASETRRDLELMLDLTDLGDWRPPIVETVASTGEGVDELWDDHRAAPGTIRSEQGTLARGAGSGWSASSTRSWWPGVAEQIDDATGGRPVRTDIPARCWTASLDPTRRPTGCWPGLSSDRPGPGRRPPRWRPIEREAPARPNGSGSVRT